MMVSMNPFRIAETPENHSPMPHADHDGCEACMPDVTKPYDRYGMKSTWAHPFEAFVCVHCASRWYADGHIEVCFKRMRVLEEKNAKWDELFTKQMVHEKCQQVRSLQLKIALIMMTLGFFAMTFMHIRGGFR